jgi:hypothetical protein
MSSRGRIPKKKTPNRIEKVAQGLAKSVYWERFG